MKQVGVGMGLDFSHCNARWSYSGFGRFRNRLADQIGFKEYEHICTTDDPRYEKIKDDGLLPFLAHSDCDGGLTTEECLKVAPRLRELLSSWSDDDRDKINGLELCEGMELAASKNEILEFL